MYRAIGLMSGSSLDGLDIVYTELDNSAGKWSYQIICTDCIAYNDYWYNQLKNALQLGVKEYSLLHTAYGHWIGEQVNNFIDTNNLHHKVQIIASHGHTVFHAPDKNTTLQIGDGAAIAAVTGINTVSDLRAMDLALGGQGAPIVPLGEKLLFADYGFCLNLGGIANISCNTGQSYIAYDVCAANRVLNMLAAELGKPFDEGGALAKSGVIDTVLLTQLNNLDYYKQPFPKSLDNSFGTDTVFALIKKQQPETRDALRTYTEHIVQQLVYAINQLLPQADKTNNRHQQLLVTGGGAFNTFLIDRLRESLGVFGIQLVVPEAAVVANKEALIMALLGVLRWREENTVLHTVTGASRSSIGGAVWIGQEA
jgi:anhydro-N-acetylmuramic acid kinase